MSMTCSRQLSPEGYHLHRPIEDLIAIGFDSFYSYITYVFLQVYHQVDYFIFIPDPDLGLLDLFLFVNREVSGRANHLLVEKLQSRGFDQEVLESFRAVRCLT